MLVLGIETSASRGSVAVARDGKTLARLVFTRSLGHSERLIPAAAAALKKARVRLDDLDGVAVGTGPGSYTGLRVGIAAAQGLALLPGIPVVGVPSFDALVASRERQLKRPVFLAVTDAKREEYYVARYEKKKGGYRRRGPIGLIGAADLERQIEKGAQAGGPELNALYPDAAAVAALGAEILKKGKPTPPPEPIYIRPFAAKKSEEQKWNAFAAAGRKSI